MQPHLALLIRHYGGLQMQAASVERRVDRIDAGLTVLQPARLLLLAPAACRRRPPARRSTPSSPFIPASKSLLPDFGSVPATCQTRGDPVIDAFGSTFRAQQFRECFPVRAERPPEVEAGRAGEAQSPGRRPRSARTGSRRLARKNRAARTSGPRSSTSPDGPMPTTILSGLGSLVQCDVVPFMS